MKAELKARPNRLGIYAAAAYVLIVAGVYAATEYGGKPSGLGYEWIPFIWLAMPWYFWVPSSMLNARWYDMVAPELCILGIILNASILYMVCKVLELLRRRFFSK
ncbi:MAG: hypothetical protein ABSD43_05755 [Terracidiphilus sp.]